MSQRLESATPLVHALSDARGQPRDHDGVLEDMGFGKQLNQPLQSQYHDTAIIVNMQEVKVEGEIRKMRLVQLANTISASDVEGRVGLHLEPLRSLWKTRMRAVGILRVEQMLRVTLKEITEQRLTFLDRLAPQGAHVAKETEQTSGGGGRSK